MKLRNLLTTLALVALGIAASSATAAELRFSLGVRETNSTGIAIGGNGGAAGGIEWVGRPNDGTDLDVALVPADNAWHQVTFDLNAGPFRGFTGDHVLSSTSGFGVLEHLRIANTADGITRYTVYIDDIVNTVNGVDTLLTNFDSAAVGSEVLFQDARFSGSTSANIVDPLVVPGTPNINRVTDAVAFSGTNSYELEFVFVDDTPAGASGAGRWARVTSSGAASLPNAVIGVPGGPTNTSLVTMQIRIAAIPEPASLMLIGLAGLGLGCVRPRK